MPSATRWTERRRVSSTGFTLLELVMVVAIAGVLMALLLPALSSAKEKSRRSVCGQNMRQDIMALRMYSDYADNQGRLPPATDNRGAYHSIRLSDFTFTNLVFQLDGESNSLYCPNLVYYTGEMGGYDPSVGYTIGYSYLAVEPLPQTPKGPDEGWTGPLKADETGKVIADANYWSTISSLPMTVAPHTAGGSIVATPLVSGAAISSLQPASVSPAPGATSTAMGAAGGNIGSLDGSVIWQPIRLLKQYPASIELDGSSGAFGNW